MLPAFVEDALTRFLGCGVASAGFVRLRCMTCGAERALLHSGDLRGHSPKARAHAEFFPHIHVLVLDGAYEELSEDELVFHDDHGPASERQHGLAEDVERRFVRWLKRHDFLDTEVIEPEGDEAWLSSAAREPSGLLRSVTEPRRTSGFDVHVGRRIEADDERGLTWLVRYLARPPFADAQLEWLDDERLRLTSSPLGAFGSPTRAGQSSVVLGRLQLLRRRVVSGPKLRGGGAASKDGAVGRAARKDV